MSKSFLYKMNGEKEGGLRSWIDGFAGEPNIAWYPTGRLDFRALMYLSNLYRHRFPTNEVPVVAEPIVPDIFIYTDASVDFFDQWFNRGDFNRPGSRLGRLIQNAADLGGYFLYKDSRTSIRVMHFENLPPISCSMYKSISGNLGSENTERKVVYMELRINSKILGSFMVPVIYINTENESFCAEYLLGKANISHVIHVRYGGLGGGGRASGIWIQQVLKALNTKVYITDENYAWQPGDRAAREIYPSLFDQTAAVCLSVYRTTPSKYWSNHSNVKWKVIH